jgi:hypothetical protein
MENRGIIEALHHTSDEVRKYAGSLEMAEHAMRDVHLRMIS